MTSKVDISVGVAEAMSIVIDGHDVTSAFCGMSISALADGSIPVLELKAWIVNRCNVNGEMEVILHQDTKDGLVALGWTPPFDEGKGGDSAKS